MRYKIFFSLLLLSVSVIKFSFSQNLKINEILSSNTTGIIDSYGDNSDWIEIYNDGNTEINLKGFYLSDKMDNPLKWRFPAFYIAPKSYLIVFASENNSTDIELHCNFKLAMEGEYIILSDSSGNFIDQLDSIPLRADISYGYQPDGSGALKYFNQPTPGTSNTTQSYDGFVEDPSLNLLGGFYAEPINIVVNHPDTEASVRYTLDGSEPDTNSPIYSETIPLLNNENEPNIISEIPTNPSFAYPMPGYDESRANNRGWLEPYQEVNKANVLKVKAFREGFLPGNTITSTYFINPLLNERYSMPVMSISTDMDNLFSDETGIYVFGTTGVEGNYNESGDEWERPITMQFYEQDGSLAFEQNFGARIHGGGGRASTIKNLRVYARDSYGKDVLKYKWFENDNANDFKRFIVRGPGHRPDCAPRDDLANLLLQNQDMDIQHYRHVIVFINGEYWGIHSVKERFDLEYLEHKYGKTETDYVILRNSGSLEMGEEGDEQPFLDLLNYIRDHNMYKPQNYEYVKTQLDIDNYLTYLTSEVFMGNVDWVNTNIKFWRYKGLDNRSKEGAAIDGKWRWFLYDFDLTFGGSCDNINPNANVMDDLFDPDGGNSTVLSSGLKENEQFVFDFVNRMCDHINSNFHPRNMAEKINQIDQEMSPEMMEHIIRWRYPSTAETLLDRHFEVPSLDQWNFILEGLHNYPTERRRKIISHLQEEFTLNDTISITLDVNDQSMGNVQINSIFISENLDGVTEGVYPWNGIYFQEVPIQIVAVPKLGYRFVKWQEFGSPEDTLLVTLTSGTSFTALFEKDPDFIFEDALFINEFMASNKNIIDDEFGAYADWIEIYNPNDKAVDLASFYISDDAEDTYKYQFPRGSKSTIIPPYGYLLIWADDRSERGELHTNFKLAATGEHIVLMAPDSSLIDDIAYGDQMEDVSFGRDLDGDPTWRFFQAPDSPTPGATNNKTAIHEMPSQEQFLIYPNPVSRGESVYFTEKMNIELYNALGVLVLKKENIRFIETAPFESGVYFIKSDKKGLTKLIVH